MEKISGTVVRTGVAALALVLAGCGGGGGGDGGSAAPAPVAQRDVQGIAAKGLIKGARVNVHALDAQGVRAGAALATTLTGADGSYKLQVPASMRNFVIELSAAPGAFMADEVTGTDIALPDNMRLRSVVTLAENATGAYTGSVSPLTEMIARTAETADGRLPQQAVAQAKTGVRTLLGFDPETVKPVNSNSAAAASASEDEKNQSLALAAISKMASTATADCGQSNAGERIACVVGKFTASLTVKDGQPTLDPDRLAQFRDAIQAVAQDKTINRTGKDKVVGMPVLMPPPTTPVPPPAGTAPTPLAATKALFGSLRTNLRSLSEGDAFRSTVDALKADLDGTVAPLGNDVTGLASLLTSATELLDNIRAGRTYGSQVDVLNDQVQTYRPSTLFYLKNGIGRCNIVYSPLSIACTVTQKSYLPGTTGNVLGGTAVYATRTLTLRPKEGSATDYSYTAFLEKNVLKHEDYKAIAEPVKEAIGSAFAGDITVARTAGTLAQVAIKGRMPGRLNASGALDSDYEDWVLDVTRTADADGLLLYKLGGAFSASRAGQQVSKVEIDNTSFLRLAQPDGSSKAAPSDANALQLTLRGMLGTTTVAGTLRMSEEKQDKSKTSRMPTSLSFEGSLEHKDAAVFSGYVDITRGGYEQFDASAAESDTNFVADTVGIGGALSLPNRPTLSLTLGATRSGLNAADISAQYRDGTSVINASVTARAGERHPLVKVASAEGVSFSFTSTSVPVPVTKDGAVVAQLDLGKGVITYSDGSTESLQ
ncbi:MAG: hypothetical protein V7631_28 [Massilia sp.]